MMISPSVNGRFFIYLFIFLDICVALEATTKATQSLQRKTGYIDIWKQFIELQQELCVGFFLCRLHTKNKNRKNSECQGGGKKGF